MSRSQASEHTTTRAFGAGVTQTQLEYSLDPGMQQMMVVQLWYMTGTITRLKLSSRAKARRICPPRLTLTGKKNTRGWAGLLTCDMVKSSRYINETISFSQASRLETVKKLSIFALQWSTSVQKTAYRGICNKIVQQCKFKAIWDALLIWRTK